MMDQSNTRSLFHINEIELLYRYPQGWEDRLKVHTSREAYGLFRASWEERRIELLEEFRLLLLDNACSCLGIAHLATGGLTGCIVDVRLVFATALKAKATRLILAHNHPTGNLRPSAADRQLTRTLIEGGILLNIGILDHLIITPDSYASMADEGELHGFDAVPGQKPENETMEHEKAAVHTAPEFDFF